MANRQTYNIKPLNLQPNNTGGWSTALGDLTLIIDPPSKFTNTKRWRYEFIFSYYQKGTECLYKREGFTSTKEDAFLKCQQEYEQFLSPYLVEIDNKN